MNKIIKLTFFVIFIVLTCNNCFAVGEVPIRQQQERELRNKRIIEVAKNSQNVKDLVEIFCLNEFHGRFLYEELFKYTPKTLKKLRDMSNGELPYLASYTSDPIHIVSSYKIIEIKHVDKKHAYVVVEYRQLAIRGESFEKQEACIKSHGYRTYKDQNICFVPKKDIRDITVRLNLEHDGKRWWIIDPPNPKVSLDIMEKYYSDEVEGLYLRIIGKIKPPIGGKYRPEVMARYKEVYKEEKAILDFLHSLKNK